MEATMRPLGAVPAPGPGPGPAPVPDAVPDPAPAARPAPRSASGSAPAGRCALFRPWVDFMLLGGGSLVVLAALAAFHPRDAAAKAALAGLMMILSHFVNHPHFAHSYQIFYRDFARKAFSPDSALRHRYRLAGVLVPVLMVTYFAVSIAQGSPELLGLAANVMYFTVGWHYAKQGYGIFMVDAAYRGVRLGAPERRRLLVNTHLTWVTWWVVTNDALAERDFWGLTYYTLDVPDALVHAMLALVAVSTLAVARDLFLRWRTTRVLPWNGLVAYVCAVYLWLAVGRIDPLLMLVVPFFHSLQYLAVVWRYQSNAERDRLHAAPPRPGRWRGWAVPARIARFVLVGGVLGAAGFWVAPVTFDTLAGYDRALFGTTLFLFLGWTFINIHHYFLDNVIWRRENPEMGRYLFGGGRGGAVVAGSVAGSAAAGAVVAGAAVAGSVSAGSAPTGPEQSGPAPAVTERARA